MGWYSSVMTYKLLFDDTLCKDALSKLKQFQVGIPVWKAVAVAGHDMIWD